MLITLLSITISVLLVGAIVCVIKGYGKSALACAFFLSWSVGAFALANAREPDVLIQMYGRTATNLGIVFLLLAAAVAFVASSVAGVILLGRAYLQKPRKTNYSTRAVGEPGPDGTWTAELSNGRARTLIDVGSISKLGPWR